MEMMRGLVETLEKHHQVRILDEAVVDAVRLSHRYISGRQLPDKSVSLLDTACARVAIGHAAVPPAVEDCRRRIEQLTVGHRHSRAREPSPAPIIGSGSTSWHQLEGRGRAGTGRAGDALEGGVGTGGQIRAIRSGWNWQIPPLPWDRGRGHRSPLSRRERGWG